MTMTLHEPTPQNVPAWLALGVRAKDTSKGRIGVVQLFRDELGALNTDHAIQHPTRVLLRPLDGSPPWWAWISQVTRPEGVKQ